MITASALQAMVEALRQCGVACADAADAAEADDVAGIGPRVEPLEQALLAVAHAVAPALEAWGKRPRLRNDPKLCVLLEELIADTMRCGRSTIASRDEFLDALDALLYGERG